MNELNSGNSKWNKGNVEMLRLGLGFLELVFSSFFFFVFVLQYSTTNTNMLRILNCLYW